MLETKQCNKNIQKKICIIRSNQVRPDSRVEKEAWSLKNMGYNVHILAWDRDTNVYETDEFIEVAGVKIPITRLGHKATFGEGFKNLKAYLGFQFHMRKWLRRNKFDVVHACDFDTAFFSQGIVRRNKEKFVFDIFDFLYGEPQNFMERCVKKAQLNIINRADATIICTEERQKQIVGSNPKKLVVVHNTPASVQIGSLSKTIESTDKVKIAYIGILQDYRLLKEITEVVADSKDIEFHIGGFGKYEGYFLEMAKKHKNIFFYGCLSYDRTLALEKQCDVMLAIYDPSIENHRFAAPNKFYEALFLGKPVIMVKGTGMSQIVETQNLGVVIEYSKNGFIDGVNSLIARRDEWSDMSLRMKKLYDQKYSWYEMEKRLEELYEHLLGNII